MIVLDALRMDTRSEAHAYLWEQLSFPEHYGCNLDALYDCLTDLDETDIRFINIEEAGGSYFDRVLDVFREAAWDNERLHLFTE